MDQFVLGMNIFNPYRGYKFIQEDKATSCVTNDSIKAVHNLFPERVISQLGGIHLPVRSPDLTPVEFFLLRK